jgi:hypothetical protein
MSNKAMQSLCGAHCRTTGQPCQNYQMPNGRCRMHGGKSTGRPTISGMFTREARSFRSRLTALNREVNRLMKEM